MCSKLWYKQGQGKGWTGGQDALGAVVYCRDGDAVWWAHSVTSLTGVVTAASLLLSVQSWWWESWEEKQVVQLSCINKLAVVFTDTQEHCTGRKEEGDREHNPSPKLTVYLYIQAGSTVPSAAQNWQQPLRVWMVLVMYGPLMVYELVWR